MCASERKVLHPCKITVGKQYHVNEGGSADASRDNIVGIIMLFMIAPRGILIRAIPEEGEVSE